MLDDFDDKWSIKEKLEKLIKSLHQRAKNVKRKKTQPKHVALFIDEMPPSFFESNPDYEKIFADLHNAFPLVYVFMAISPSGKDLTKALDIKFDAKGKIFAKQLRSRHRNSFLLASFLIHLTYYYNELNRSDSTFKCLIPNQDLQLEPSNLPAGEVTLWYHQSEDISEVEILEFVKSTYLPKEGQVLLSPCEQNFSTSVYDWCQKNDWDIVSHGNMTGSERDLVIAFADDNFGNLEVMSRARKRLIIVTKYV